MTAKQNPDEIEEPVVLMVPDYDPDDPEPYPGGIEPGYYTLSQFIALLRHHADNPEAIRFLADMLEM